MKANYILFFLEKEDSFTIQLSNCFSKRKPLLSKLGSLETEQIAFESETANEHLPVKGQTDFDKNPWADRILLKINKEISHIERLELELRRLQKTTMIILRKLTQIHKNTLIDSVSDESSLFSQ